MDEVVAQVSSLGGNSISIHADISTEDACRNAVKDAADQLGGLDIIVNNAAPERNREAVGAMSNADWSAHGQVVLSATVHIVDAAQWYLAKSENASVVNISSVVGTAIGIDHCSWPYHVSKAGLDHLTRWLAVRFGPMGIRVNAIAPGLIDRNSLANSKPDPMRSMVADNIIPLRRAGTADDIGNTALFLCSNYASYITGQVLVVDGGLNLSEVCSTAMRMYETLQNT
jgi:NAD(P)-dependent dehydrogenase (short-subunit alcohol dehydrogenase family)